MSSAGAAMMLPLPPACCLLVQMIEKLVEHWSGVALELDEDMGSANVPLEPLDALSELYRIDDTAARELRRPACTRCRGMAVGEHQDCRLVAQLHAATAHCHSRSPEGLARHASQPPDLAPFSLHHGEELWSGPERP
jgi:hypothetical protein